MLCIRMILDPQIVQNLKNTELAEKILRNEIPTRTKRFVDTSHRGDPRELDDGFEYIS